MSVCSFLYRFRDKNGKRTISGRQQYLKVSYGSGSYDWKLSVVRNHQSHRSRMKVGPTALVGAASRETQHLRFSRILLLALRPMNLLHLSLSLSLSSFSLTSKTPLARQLSSEYVGRLVNPTEKCWWIKTDWFRQFPKRPMKTPSQSSRN